MWVTSKIGSTYIDRDIEQQLANIDRSACSIARNYIDPNFEVSIDGYAASADLCSPRMSTTKE